MSIRHALTSTTTKSINMVATGVSVADRALTSLDNYTVYIEEHSAMVAENARDSFRLSAAEMKKFAEQDAKHRIAMRQQAHDARLEDLDYKAIYDSITFNNQQALPDAS